MQITWFASRCRKTKICYYTILSGEKYISIPLFWTTKYCLKQTECPRTIWQTSWMIIWWRFRTWSAVKNGYPPSRYTYSCTGLSVGKIPGRSLRICRWYWNPSATGNSANVTVIKWASPCSPWNLPIRKPVKNGTVTRKTVICPMPLSICLPYWAGIPARSKRYFLCPNCASSSRWNA